METFFAALRDFIREVIKELLPQLLPEQKPEPAAYTAEQFCEAHGISMSSFRKMRREGWAPDIMMFGTRHMISRESAREWRKAREEEAKSEAAQLEHERRVAHGKIIGAKAVASPFHVSKGGARKKARSIRQ